MVRWLVVLILVVPLGRASVSCVAPETLAARTVCASPDLSRWNATQARTFDKAREAAERAGQVQALEAEERAWVESLSRCKTEICLRDALRARMKALVRFVEQLPAATAGEPASTRRTEPDAAGAFEMGVFVVVLGIFFVATRATFRWMRGAH